MVPVLYDGSMNVGYITGKISSLYREAVDRHDSAGEPLWVHGRVREDEDDGGLNVEMWCLRPDDL
jgi:hypothetical protein